MGHAPRSPCRQRGRPSHCRGGGVCGDSRSGGPVPVTVDSPAPGPPWSTVPCPELWTRSGQVCAASCSVSGQKTDRTEEVPRERTVELCLGTDLGRDTCGPCLCVSTPGFRLDEGTTGSREGGFKSQHSEN